MLLVILGLACVASVPLAGGRLMNLANLDVQAVWTLLVSAALQVMITSVRGGDHAIHVALHFCSYGLVAWFLFANRRLAGMTWITLGAALNVLAISANGGTMPAAATALRIAGIHMPDGFANSGAVAHPRLLPLGDVIPIPGPWPIGNVLSVGDLLIVAGVLVLAHVACQSRLAPRSRRRSPSGTVAPQWSRREQNLESPQGAGGSFVLPGH